MSVFGREASNHARAELVMIFSITLAKLKKYFYICKIKYIIPMIDNVSLDLMAFVETQILPRYAAFDKAHNIID